MNTSLSIDKNPLCFDQSFLFQLHITTVYWLKYEVLMKDSLILEHSRNFQKLNNSYGHSYLMHHTHKTSFSDRQTD